MNNPNQLSGLKGRMISEVEQVVNDLRKRIELNRTELEQFTSATSGSASNAATLEVKYSY